jgi:hypothetical protein
MAKKLCYHRYYNGIYLLTCGLPKGHAGDHVEMDGVATWLNDQGFWDKYGD